MSRRHTFLVNGEIYHIFNHSIAGIPIFKGERENHLFLESMKFYLQLKPPTKFSIYRRNRKSFPIQLDQRVVTIINYCLMPNHFHFTLRQEKENGIQQFMHRLSNSFAHYFTVKYHKKGHVFEDKFKAVHIETEEQLIHLSRYIHLNPVTAFLVEEPEDYSYSSYKVYLGKDESDLIDPSPVLASFPSKEKYKEFVMSQKDYQRTLDRIKHLTLE